MTQSERKSRLRYLHLGFALWMILLLLACAGTTTGGNQATAPAPVAELPALQFPDGVGIDTGPIDNSLSGKGLSFIAIGDSVSADIERISIANSFLSQFVDRLVLAPLAPLRIPRGSNVTTFEDVIVANDTVANIKIDFAPYRFDASDTSGAGLDCSGNTAGLPICYRIWIDDVRALAGIFYEVPEGENPGIGRFKGFPIEKDVEGMVASNYDHFNPLAKETEIFSVNGRELGHGIQNEDSVGENVFVTLNLAFLEAQNATRNVAKFERSSQFIGLSQESNEPQLMNYLGICADLITKLVVDPGFCQATGVDVSGIPFTDFATVSDTALPDDFPPSPTFQDSPFHSQ